MEADREIIAFSFSFIRIKSENLEFLILILTKKKKIFVKLWWLNQMWNNTLKHFSQVTLIIRYS